MLFAAISLRIGAKVRRVSNLMKMTEHHRGLWTQLISQPALSRVLSAAANARRKPITREERWFVVLLILHISTAYRAMKDGLSLKPEGLHKDIHWLFSFPITKAVWEMVKPFQDKDFVRFIEQCRQALSVEQLDNLGEALLDFSAPAELEAWLASHGHQNTRRRLDG